MLNEKESPPNALGVLHYFVIHKFFMVSSLHRLVRLIIQNVPGKIKRGKIHRKGVGKMFEMIGRWQGQAVGVLMDCGDERIQFRVHC